MKMMGRPLNSLSTTLTKGGTQKSCPPKKINKVSKPTDMTVHWKALEEHLLLVPLVFWLNPFQGWMHFMNFSQKTKLGGWGGVHYIIPPQRRVIHSLHPSPRVQPTDQSRESPLLFFLVWPSLKFVALGLAGYRHTSRLSTFLKEIRAWIKM
jgi:hypothetical protein